MAVTIPRIMSKTAAIQRSPPQEVKSTCDEKQVINRMKEKSISFKPHESSQDNVKEDQSEVKNNNKRNKSRLDLSCTGQKCNFLSSRVASVSEVEFPSYLKMS